MRFGDESDLFGKEKDDSFKGSPVVQNGKFIGAVTHVFVQDSTSGYEIFAETMLEQ